MDTHALVWYIRGFKILSPKAFTVIKEIFTNKAICYLSTMAILEAYYIGLKDSSFDFMKFLKIINRPNIIIAPFDSEVLNQCYVLSKKFDIHDWIIVATAIITNTPLVTKDRILRKLFPKETVW